MKKFSILNLASAVIAITASAASNAAILSSSASSPTGGSCGTSVTVSSAVTVPVPDSCVLHAFNEQQLVTLGSVLPAGNIGPASTVAAGTLVNSHLIAWNPSGNGDQVNANITFDGIILAVYSEAPNLNATNGVLGLVAPFTFVNGQGLETADSVTVGTDGVSLRFSASNPGDYIRVVTQVPLPGAAPLLALGLLGLAAVRRKA